MIHERTLRDRDRWRRELGRPAARSAGRKNWAPNLGAKRQPTRCRTPARPGPSEPGGAVRGDLEAHVRAQTDDRGVVVAFDFVGGDMKRLCFRAIGFDGQVVSIVEEPPEFGLDL